VASTLPCSTTLGKLTTGWIMDTNRLEAFSDGVFAISITLLVLEIKVPPSGSALGTELLSLWPSYLAYAISFIVIGAIGLPPYNRSMC
jgi:uncharacterized membrane protein